MTNEDALREKLRKIEALGIDPWGARFDGHQSIASIRELDAQPFDDTKPEANARVIAAADCFPTGMLGHYARRLAEGGLIAVITATSPARLASPDGPPAAAGATPLAGTNPLAIGIPAGKQPAVIIDTATSVASAGMIKAAALRGEKIPEGWMIDPATGEAVTDPAKMMQSLLMPIGEHKGSGLALAIGLLAGSLNGAAFGRDIPCSGSGFGVNSGQFVIALDVARFVPPATFGAELDRHIGDIAQSKPLPGVTQVRVPGQERARRKCARTANGIAISAPLAKQLNTLAQRFKINLAA